MAFELVAQMADRKACETAVPLVGPMVFLTADQKVQRWGGLMVGQTVAQMALQTAVLTAFPTVDQMDNQMAHQKAAHLAALRASYLARKKAAPMAYQ